MRNKSYTRMLLGSIVIAGVFLFLHFHEPENTGNSCKESMGACCHKDATGNKMIWENLSHQFFSSF